MLLVTTQPTVS